MQILTPFTAIGKPPIRILRQSLISDSGIVTVSSSVSWPEISSEEHESSIFRQSSNPVSGFSMMEHVRFCAAWPTENWLGSSMNHIQGWNTVWICYWHARQNRSLLLTRPHFLCSFSLFGSTEKTFLSWRRSLTSSLAHFVPFQISASFHSQQRHTCQPGSFSFFAVVHASFTTSPGNEFLPLVRLAVHPSGSSCVTNGNRGVTTPELDFQLFWDSDSRSKNT